MTQDQLFEPLSTEQLNQFNNEEVRRFVTAQARVIADLSRQLTTLKDRDEKLKQRTLQIDEEFIILKGQVIQSSLRPETNKVDSNQEPRESKHKKKKVQLPSQRYPHAEVIEQEIGFRDTPTCESCQSDMSFMGQYEICEHLTVTPAAFRIIRQLRQKYRCSCCHGSIKTVPTMPRICPGGAYSDEMIIDVVISKYCDLIPIERYAAMASRGGLIDLPPQSLIQLTHYFANFVKPIYERIRLEILKVQVLHADETPHKMLEQWGVDLEQVRKSWYLWGFSDNKGSSYFEVRNTRSGDVASSLLKDSVCEYLVSDVFSGYNKSVRETNIERQKEGLKSILNIYCNSHAYRKFKDLEDDEFEDVRVLYKKIYRLENIAQRRPNEERKLRARQRMKKLFEEIKSLCLSRLSEYSKKSKESRAMVYFLKNYEPLTRFADIAVAPIDNNPQERQMRSPVVGRKTWYGNHSLKGATTTAILFSVIESCKLAGINPREYLRKLVESIHLGQLTKTPSEFAQSI